MRLATLLLLAACSVPADPPVTPAATESFDRSAPIPDTSLYMLRTELVDQAAQTIDLSVHRGHPTVVGMFYASCPMACPMMIEELKGIEAALPQERRDDLRFLLVSLDPERDGPALFKDVIATHNLDDRWTLVRAESHDVRSIAAVLGIQYRKIANGELHHETILTVLDRQGVPAGTLSGVKKDPATFRQAILAVP